MKWRYISLSTERFSIKKMILINDVQIWNNHTYVLSVDFVKDLNKNGPPDSQALLKEKKMACLVGTEDLF